VSIARKTEAGRTQRNFYPDILGAFLAVNRQKPGFPLQFLGPPAAALRDFRCNPLRAQGFSGF
jgi:hypothetical protein